jgi:hypothetical protein
VSGGGLDGLAVLHDDRARDGQLDLERHGGRTPGGVYARITQRLLAMATAIWHNWAAGEPAKRSLTAYDH